MSGMLLNGLVGLLVLQLGHPHYRHRETAHRVLAGLAWAASPALERATGCPDAEIARRAAQLWEPYRLERCDRLADGLCDRWPWIWLGTSYACPEALQWVALAEASGASGGGPDWQNYRMAARLWARQALRDRVPVETVRTRLNEMADAERRWIEALR